MMYVLLVVGFVLLIKGADLFVDGSSSIAKLLRVPSVVIGLTIVAMGTSAPEAAVSITAGLAGNNDIALSNVIGSNLFNLLMVVGVCALIRAFDVDRFIMKRDFPVCVGASVILLGYMLDGELSQLEGVIMLLLIVAYLLVMVRSALQNRTEAAEGSENLSVAKSILFVLVGVCAIVFGGDLVVDNASEIALQWGWSQTLVGLTIVAVGTSLPELVTSIVAARKGESGLALGNVVGSNIFNILFIMGMSSGLHRIRVSPESVIDMGVSIVVTLIMLVFCRLRGRMGRAAGLVSVAAYVVYMGYVILR